MRYAALVAALIYSVIVSGGIVVLWFLAISPSDTGVGFIEFFGYQAFVVAGNVFVFVGVWAVAAVLGGVGVAGVALLGILLEHGVLREREGILR